MTSAVTLNQHGVPAHTAADRIGHEAPRMGLAIKLAVPVGACFAGLLKAGRVFLSAALHAERGRAIGGDHACVTGVAASDEESREGEELSHPVKDA